MCVIFPYAAQKCPFTVCVMSFSSQLLIIFSLLKCHSVITMYGSDGGGGGLQNLQKKDNRINAKPFGHNSKKRENGLRLKVSRNAAHNATACCCYKQVKENKAIKTTVNIRFSVVISQYGCLILPQQGT